MSVFEVLRYAPVLRGFVVLMIAGSTFPLVGVFVLRLNLVTLRFTLMHATLLGGAIALAAGLPTLTIGLAVNLLVVLGIVQLRHAGRPIGAVTTFFMVVTVGLAFAIMYRFNVPANDSLQILWGNIYALSTGDAVATVGFALGVVGFVVWWFPQITAVLYDREIAVSVGVRERLLYTCIVLVVGLSIGFVMRLIGALLLDAILILPALMAIAVAKTMRGVFIAAAVFGFFVSIGGFVLAVGIDVPASSGVTLFGALLFAVVHIVAPRIRRGRRAPAVTGPHG